MFLWQKDVPLDNFLSAEMLSSIWSSQIPTKKGEIESSWIGEGIKLEFLLFCRKIDFSAENLFNFPPSTFYKGDLAHLWNKMYRCLQKFIPEEN